jgi:tetratricopeptide (TPR) repeat protein
MTVHLTQRLIPATRPVLALLLGLLCLWRVAASEPPAPHARPEAASAPKMKSLPKAEPLPPEPAAHATDVGESKPATHTLEAAADHLPHASTGDLPILNEGKHLETDNLNPPPPKATAVSTRNYQEELALAREQRRQKNFDQSERMLEKLMTTNAPPEVHRQALLELAFVAQDQNKLTRTVQVLSQYTQRFPEDPSVPEIHLRQGLIYRQLGANGMAIGRFYLVLSSALQLKLDQMAYYQRLVLQAKTEIADTFFSENKFEDASELYRRLLKLDSEDLNRPHVHFKLVRCLAALGKTADTIAEGESFVQKHPESQEVPEVRFILASIYKQQGRNGEATKQVVQLLDGQKQRQLKNPELWAYWQQRAGNDIANQLYRDGDYLNALEIYRAMAAMNQSVAWQLPALYQCGLIFERLQQPAKAKDAYTKILAREKDLAALPEDPALQSVMEMAKWRKDYLAWLEKTAIDRELLRPADAATNVAASL